MAFLTSEKDGATTFLMKKKLGQTLFDEKNEGARPFLTKIMRGQGLFLGYEKSQQRPPVPINFESSLTIFRTFFYLKPIHIRIPTISTSQKILKKSYIVVHDG